MVAEKGEDIELDASKKVDLKKIPRFSWSDTIDSTKALLYRLSLAIDIPFSEFERCTIEQVNEEWTVQSNSEITFWHVKQRAYYFGQKRVVQLVDIRDAILDAEDILHTDSEKDREDTFKNSFLSIAFDMERPRSKYFKARRAFIKSHKNGR